MVSLSLFAGLKRILRRFSIFAEEPHKSIITAIEPCNPVLRRFSQDPPSESNLSFHAAHLYKMFSNCYFIVIKHPTGLCQNKRI